MKVGLVLEPIDHGSPGFRTYAHRLMRGLLEDGRHEYKLIHRRKSALIPEDREVLLPHVPGGPLAKQLVVPFLLLPQRFDLVHDVYHFPPYTLPTPFTRVMTIGDLTPLIVPTHRSKNVLMHRLFVGRLARRCHHIVTFSACSKRDIVRLLRVPAERITVTHLAADERFAPGDAGDALARLRERYDLPGRFFLQLGTIEPRKNLRATLAAFRRIASHVPDVHLAVVGPAGWGESGLDELEKSPELAGRVMKLGNVPDEDVALLYRAALALVYPSLYEGFGLPPLEAMQSGCPVITSDTSSLPEVVGGAALTCAPDDVDAIAAHMLMVTEDEGTRAALSQRGLARAGAFSWKRTTDATLAGYERAIAQRGRLAREGVESLL